MRGWDAVECIDDWRTRQPVLLIASWLPGRRRHRRHPPAHRRGGADPGAADERPVAGLDAKAGRYEASSENAQMTADRIGDAIPWPCRVPSVATPYASTTARLTGCTADTAILGRRPDRTSAARRTEITRAGQGHSEHAAGGSGCLKRLETKHRQLTGRINDSSYTFSGGYVETTAPATGHRPIRLNAERGSGR